jgi:multiple antibiotic resistance protein
MLQYILYFLVLMNPIALFVYIIPLKRDLGFDNFLKVLKKASFISFVIFAVFAVFGTFIFTDIFQIRFSSFRLFGGVLLVAFALKFILQGNQAMIDTKGQLDSIASEVALPYMVGSTTIALAILMGNRFGPLTAVSMIGAVMAFVFAIVTMLAVIREHATPVFKVAMDTNLQILLRINGFFIGAIGFDLIASAIQQLFNVGGV